MLEIKVAEELLQEYAMLQKKQKVIEDRMNQIKKKFMEGLEEGQKIEYQGYSAQKTLSSTRTIFDSKQFKKDFSDVYEEYTKESKVSSSIRFTDHHDQWLESMNEKIAEVEAYEAIDV